MSIEPQSITGELLALVAWGDGEQQDTAVIAGPVEWNGSQLELSQGAGNPTLPIPDAWVSRLAPVPVEVKAMLMNAGYFISVSRDELPENVLLPEI